jgi:hypothetical protein
VGVVRLIRMLGVALLWALGVAMVASTSWVAINSAGRQVVDTTLSTGAGGARGGLGSDAGAAGAVPDQVGRTPSGVTSLAPPSSISRSGPTASGSPRRSAGTVEPSPAGSLPNNRVAPRTPAPGGDAGTVPPTASGPSPLSDTMSTVGGVVWLQCTGAKVSNYLAQPSSDWSGTADQPDAGTLLVDFVHLTSGIRVIGSCPSGQPHFDVGTYTSQGGDVHGED